MTFSRYLLSAWGVFVCLFCFCITGLLSAADNSEPNFAPGEEVRVDANNKLIGGDYFLVYVPADYNDKHDWPAIFVYHGQDGQPTTWPLRQATDGKGFIVVGMGYVPGGDGPMTEGRYINYFKRERRSILEVKRYVSKRLRIDEKRLFISGFSKGGWHTAAMLESSPRVWAGAVILAAGRSRNTSLINSDVGKIALRNKPVYIGVGEKDTNLAPAKKAAVYYENAGAKVTFEEFKGAEHSFDPSGSETLRNWLVINSSVENTQSGQTD